MKGNFRERRYALGLSQKSLAEKAGVIQSCLSKMESGVHKDTNISGWKVEETLSRLEGEAVITQLDQINTRMLERIAKALERIATALEEESNAGNEETS